MVFRHILKTKWILKKPEYSLYLGVAYTIISFITAYLLFFRVPTFIGIATIMIIIMITVPTINTLITYEEKIEAKAKAHFFRKHKTIISFFVYFFIGIFIVFFMLALISPNMVFSKEQLYGAKVTTVQPKGLPPLPISMNKEIFSIFKNNFYVMGISFILSLFYGAGALFLIIINASIFASALADVIRLKAPAGLSFLANYGFIACNLGIMFFHMIPEVGSYLLAAIAGGVLGKAILKEKFWSKRFYRIVKDSIILLVISFVVVLIGAIIEIVISKRLFLADVCVTNMLIVTIIAAVVIIGVILFEQFRKRKL